LTGYGGVATVSVRAGGEFADEVIQFADCVMQYEAERARRDRLFTLEAAFARRSDPAKVTLPRVSRAAQ